jgi:hypothetical protein
MQVGYNTILNLVVILGIHRFIIGLAYGSFGHRAEAIKKNLYENNTEITLFVSFVQL